VPANSRSGLEVSLNLWRGIRGGPDFVQFMMRPACDDLVAWDLAFNIAAEVRESQPVCDTSGLAPSGPLVMLQDPTDPVYIDEPHAHDLTLDQAKELHKRLGDLLAQARR
jgi:hypothetical protein